MGLRNVHAFNFKFKESLSNFYTRTLQFVHFSCHCDIFCDTFLAGDQCKFVVLNACRPYLAARARLDAFDPSGADFADAERDVISATMDICFSASANLALDSTIYEVGRRAAERGHAARSGKVSEQ